MKCDVSELLRFIENLAFQRFSFEIPFQTTFFVESFSLIFPDREKIHSPRRSTSPVVYYEEQDAGRFSAQERQLWSVSGKNNLQRFEWSKVSRL